MRSQVCREHSWQITTQGMVFPPFLPAQPETLQIEAQPISGCIYSRSVNGEASHLSPISSTVWLSIKHLLSPTTHPACSQMALSYSPFKMPGNHYSWPHVTIDQLPPKMKKTFLYKKNYLFSNE